MSVLLLGVEWGKEWGMDLDEALTLLKFEQLQDRMVYGVHYTKISWDSERRELTVRVIPPEEVIKDE